MAKLGQYGHQLENMTAQEVFDVVVEHLLTQMKKSENDDTCLYNGDEVCCAAAPFIKDYDVRLDKGGYGWGDVVEEGFAYNNHQSLIVNLQYIHDDVEVENWSNELRELAEREGLQYNGEQYE